MIEAGSPQFDMNKLKEKVDLTFQEAAFYMRLATRTLYNSWRRRGLTAYKNHLGELEFKRAELDHYMKTAKRKA